MRLFKRFIFTAAFCMILLPGRCRAASAASAEEAALRAYYNKLGHETIRNESTTWFSFKRPLDLNNDGVPELIVSQTTSCPVVYSYYNGAARIIYQGSGDGSIVRYYPEAGIFVEISGRRDEYRVWYCRTDGMKSKVLFSYSYEGEPMSLISQDYVFDHYDVTWYKGNSYQGSQITRENFETMYNKYIGDAAAFFIDLSSYKNTEENRRTYILGSGASQRTLPDLKPEEFLKNLTEDAPGPWPAAPKVSTL